MDSQYKNMDKEQRRQFIKTVAKACSEDNRVLFAYLYGSILSEDSTNDIDIAVYARQKEDPHQLSADLKVALYKETGLAPDVFDIRILNDLNKHADIFGLLYLRNVLENGQVLVDREPDVRFEFIDRYGSRFRECEGLIEELLA